MPKYSDLDLLAAVEAVRKGKSKRAAAREFKVPRSTLHDRLAGGPSREQANSDAQNLSAVQEDHLTQWILIQHGLGQGPNHHQIKLAAEGVLRAAGINKSLGKLWTSRFLKRHPSLKPLVGKRTDIKRINGVPPD
jgi:Tc5 transposase DNA-binding domain/helix-turn-helix, Psq domain